MLFIRLILALTCLWAIPLSAEPLNGGVSKSNELGMVGLTRGLCNTVSRVVRYSPAWLSDVQPGDVIVSVDGKKGKDCTGDPGSYARVLFRRKGKEILKTIQRTPESRIEKLAQEYGYTKL